VVTIPVQVFDGWLSAGRLMMSVGFQGTLVTGIVEMFVSLQSHSVIITMLSVTGNRPACAPGAALVRGSRGLGVAG
jgi:hypothetical protein